VLLYEEQSTTVVNFTDEYDGAVCNQSMSGVGNALSGQPADDFCGGPSFGKYATGNVGGRSLTTISQGTVHTGGANYLAYDGHVKYLRPGSVSGGNSNTSGTNPQDTPANAAAGTSNMTVVGGGVAMTFSPT